MIAETIAHLKATTGETGLKLIEGAAEFQKIVEQQKNPRATPAAYVIPVRETAQPSATYGRVRQQRKGGVTIVLVVKNVADARGEAAHGDMVDLRNLVDAQLLGWSPSEQHDPYQFGGGGLAAFKDGHMWWQDIYDTAFTKSQK